MFSDPLKLLTYIKQQSHFCFSGYHNSTLFDNCELVSSKWLNYKKNEKYFDPPTRSDSITFAHCTRNKIFVAGLTDLRVELTIYEQENSSMFLRCEYVFSVPIKENNPIYQMIKDVAERNILTTASYTYQQKQEEKLEKEIKKIALEMIKEL